MAQTDTSQTIEHLKRFLIIRLLAVMVFIFACEAIINLIVTRIMFLFLIHYLGQSRFLQISQQGKILSYCCEWPVICC